MKVLYLCGGCYYNTDNDYFPPAFDQNGKANEECELGQPLFPKARVCAKFELANRDPEATE